MKIKSVFIAVLVLALGIVTIQAHAASRGVRADAPQQPCFTPNWGQLLDTSSNPLPDPYANQDGNSDGTQSPSTFFNPGTVVTQPAIFCAPTVAFLAGTFPPQGDSANPASQPELNPNQDPITGCSSDSPQDCGAGPTIAALTAKGGVAGTGAVMYEWINSTIVNGVVTPDPELTPDAEVVVWTLPSGATLPNGAFEIEFDNWCTPNDNSPSGVPPNLPPLPPPSFTWNGIQYKYLVGCSNFYGDDLLLDTNSGVIIGYVVNSTDATNNTIVPGSTARGWQAMTTPVGVKAATGGSGSVMLSWTPTAGASSYNIYQASASGGEGNTPVKLGITAPSGTITGLTNGLSYFFNVSAIYSSTAYPSGFESGKSAEVSATIPPAAPAGLHAAISAATSISLQWNASAGASSYNVYQGSTSGAESATPIASGLTATSFSVTGLIPGQSYFFDVVGVGAGGSSSVSNEATATLVASAPSGLTAIAGATSVALKWTTSTGATSYNVYQGTSAGGESTTPIVTGITATSYNVSSLTSGQVYFFKLVAVDAGGNSAASSEVTTTVLAAVPSGLSATAANGAVTLSWTASTGATSYNIYQGSSAGGEGNSAATSVSATSMTISGLTNGQTYYFKVAAVDAGGTSAQSNESSATPAAPPAPPPASSGGGGGGSIDLIDLIAASGLLLLGLRHRRLGGSRNKTVKLLSS